VGADGGCTTNCLRTALPGSVGQPRKRGLAASLDHGHTIQNCLGHILGCC
jgi:hypothetical protein